MGAGRKAAVVIGLIILVAVVVWFVYPQVFNFNSSNGPNTNTSQPQQVPSNATQGTKTGNTSEGTGAAVQNSSAETAPTTQQSVNNSNSTQANNSTQSNNTNSAGTNAGASASAGAGFARANAYINFFPFQVARAEKAKVDVDTGTLPTFIDSKGIIHIRGWVKNITKNATDTDFSVDNYFNNGQFLRFFLTYESNPAKVVVTPGGVMFWDYATTNKAYSGPYAAQVRYNEIPYSPLVNLK